MSPSEVLHNDTPKTAPSITISPGHNDIPVISAVKPLTYEEANAKIREGADSFSFNGTGNCRGRVDVVSLGTKVPSEDHWDVGIINGVDGRDTLYAGIYDGHK